MTYLVPAIASILALALLAWVAGKVSRMATCPVCVGVSGTWLWMLAARFAGLAIDTTILAILLGASVAGMAQWFADRLPQGRSALLWKALALSTGSIVAYALVAEQWLLAASATLAYVIFAVLFRLPRRVTGNDDAVVAQLEERMKKCC